MRKNMLMIGVALLAVGCEGKAPNEDAAAMANAVATGNDATAVSSDHSARAEAGDQLLVAAGMPAAAIHEVALTPADTEVPSTLPFREQVERHALVLEKLIAALNDSKARKEFAEANRLKAGMFDQYLAAAEDERNTTKYLIPYSVGQAKAQALVADGYKLTSVSEDRSWTGEICNSKGQCAEVSPIEALIMMLASAFVGEINKKEPFGSNNELTKAVKVILVFLERPLGGPNSELVKIREALLFNDQNGEISRLIRDPVKRPMEIIAEARDKIIPKDDNGELAKAIRDPIKCTIGHIWGGC